MCIRDRFYNDNTVGGEEAIGLWKREESRRLQGTDPPQYHVVVPHQVTVTEKDVSPMPIENPSPTSAPVAIEEPRITGTSQQQQQPLCKIQDDGSYGNTQDGGDDITVFFFYQVEAIPGTNDTQMNSVLLGEVEHTLASLLLPALFEECKYPTVNRNGLLSTMTKETEFVISSKATTGEYVGFSSKPADFVLRGCKSCQACVKSTNPFFNRLILTPFLSLVECTLGAPQPCFVVSGSMHVYTTDMDREAVRLQMRNEIYLIMSSGAISAAIPGVTGVSLLTDSLELATVVAVSIPQSTPAPSLREQTTIAPTTAQITTTGSPSSPQPTSQRPSVAPTTDAPTFRPATDSPTSAPTATPSTQQPTTLPTAESTSVEAAATQTPSKGSTGVPTFGPTPRPSKGLVYPQTATPDSATLSPTKSTSSTTTEQQQQQVIYIDSYQQEKTAVEQLPVFAWIFMFLAVCVCCTLSAPDDDEDDPGVHQNLRAQEQHDLMDHYDQAGEKEHSEYFSTKQEYQRKLYRQ